MSPRAGLGIHLDFGSEPGCGQDAAIGRHCVVSHLPGELRRPSLDIAAIGIHPIEPSLRILVLPLHGTIVDLK